MIQSENSVIGDFFKIKLDGNSKAASKYRKELRCSLGVGPDSRETMVLLIEELHRLKNYRDETLFIAVSIADRFLHALALQSRRAPLMISLGITALLLAAKMNESKQPCYSNMAN